MKIEWNKVTWYSKAIALGVFVGLVIVAFWFGVDYGVLAASIINNHGVSLTSSSVASSGILGSEYYNNPAEWQTFNDSRGGYAISYPIDFSTAENYSITPSQDWQILAAATPGDLGFTLTIPASFEPQTNFADAKLTVGWSANDASVSHCLNPDTGFAPGSIATSSISMNGIDFTVFHASQGAAGSTYDTTSYRTLRAGQCYAIEYTVHSGEIANYPTSYNLQPFNETMVTGLLDRIVGTFTFN